MRAVCGGLLLLTLGQSDDGQCQLRNCLPPDSTQNPPLCYTQTVATQKPATQSFGPCPADYSFCEYCVTEPPCESPCRAEAMARRPPGAECYFDEQCSGHFAKCMQRVCKRALYTWQKCVAEDVNDVCVFGQKSCFRNRCQGLRPGLPCQPAPEGLDLDCNPGWYCFLGICTPQLPAGHTCMGQHQSECVRGYRCNLALDSPKCIRDFTLNLGEASSVPSLCKTNHINPGLQACAEVPGLVFKNGKAVVSARDCLEDSECPRADASIGKCACKRWWEGHGTAGYCELFVQDSSRPAFKRFWESSMRLCHHDWTEERCAVEIELEDVLKSINNEREVALTDPTTVQECAWNMLSTEFADFGVAPRQVWVHGVVLTLLGVMATISCVQPF